MLGYLHHRGKGSGPGEIGRWFDEHFQQEIEEHGERMRELISGRDPSIDVGWDEAADAKKRETVPFRKTRKPGDDEDEELKLETGDVEMVRRRARPRSSSWCRDSAPSPIETRATTTTARRPRRRGSKQNPLELLAKPRGAARRSAEARRAGPAGLGDRWTRAAAGAADRADTPARTPQKCPASSRRFRR